MQKTCKQCSAGFEVTDEDLAFYEKVSPEFGGKKYMIPPPTLCSDCRSKRRHSHRNERNLYYRKCDFSGEQMLSSYAPERKVPVYHHRHWWSDAWDPKSYGKDVDVSRSFFEQFSELQQHVPQMNVAVGNVENCDYCHLIADCRNSYLVFESSHADDCLHGYWLQKCQNCCDVSFSHECRYCYEIDNCYNCDHVLWSQNCTNCHDSLFLRDCIGCSDCLFCMNLRQKQYCILNKQYSKAEYMQKMQEIQLGSHACIMALKAEFERFRLTQPHRHQIAQLAEHCRGNYLQECKNCDQCYHGHQAENCKFGEHVWRGAFDCQDVITGGRNATLLYETTNTGINTARCGFCIQCWSCSDTYYSSACNSCQYCFGCIGLRHSRYCILNTQYSKEEYEELLPKLLDTMRNQGAWGEFFPASISLYDYTETTAFEKFGAGEKTLSKSDAYLGPKTTLADRISDTEEIVTQKILACEVSGKPYKIIPQELKFYRDMGIPIPRRCPDQRHKDRMELRNPQKLWNRQCTKCQAAIETTYTPDRPEIVYCEKCYLETVY
jgi:hypothetical protein